MADEKKWPVPASELPGLARYLPATVGATNSYPMMFPSEFTSIGIKRRDSVRNDLLGTTTSRPATDMGVIGVSYVDKHDGHDNEDFFTVDESAAEVTYWPPGSFERAYPQYANLHHAAKPHLRPPLPKPAQWRVGNSCRAIRQER